MGTPLLMGVDVGTSSTKGCLTTTAGAVAATAERPHQIDIPRPGWAEQDPDGWWSDLQAVSRDLLRQVKGGTVAAVSASGMGPCVVLTDARGRVLRPAILYGIDSRATNEIAELNERFGAGAILERSGSPLTTQSVGPKLAWVARHEPEVWKDATNVFTTSSFLAYRLTGATCLDHSTASQWGPLYDLRAGRWNAAWAEQVAPGLALPDLRWPADIVGRVTPEAAQATGLPEGIPVASGSLDTRMEAVAAGVRAPGDGMVMYGTSIFLLAMVERADPDPHLWSTIGLTPGSFAMAAGMATGGALTSWFRRLVGSGAPDFAALEEEAAGAVPGSGGLVVLPYFAGERTPLFDPDARGLVIGLTVHHDRGEFYRSLLEGVAYGVRHNLETLDAAGARPERLVAVGGGTRGLLWPRIVSDVTGMAQEVAMHPGGAAIGDARIAGIAAGLVDPNEPWPVKTVTIAPDPANRELYDAAYRVYRELYPATKAAMHALARQLPEPGPAPTM